MESLATKYHGKDAKITVATVKEVNSKIEQDECTTVNTIDILQSLLRGQVPPERISGVINLFYALDADKSKEELEHALVRPLP